MKQPEEKSRLHFSSLVALAEGEKTSVCEALRVGTILDRSLDITAEMLSDYVTNFKGNAYGTQLQVNLGHYRDGEAAGWIKNLFVEGESLMMEVEWTELGVEKITKKLYQYVSSELAMEYPHADGSGYVKNVFIGCALTNTPAMKHQEPLKLSEDERARIANITHQTAMFNKLIKDLKGREKLSAADVSFARTMLSEVAEAEKAAATKDVEDLEAKQKAQEEADKKAADEAAAKKNGDLSEKLKDTVPLSEHLALKERVEKQELKENLGKTLVLSTSVKTGFKDADLDEVVSFCLGLTPKQREAFSSLVGKVASVDLNTIGGSGAASVDLSGDQEEQIVSLAEKKFNEAKASGNAITMAEAQKAATAEVKGKK